MRRIILTLALACLVSPVLGWPHACTGAADCRVCKNCNYCKHCAKEGGTCGVCKHETATPHAKTTHKKTSHKKK